MNLKELLAINARIPRRLHLDGRGNFRDAEDRIIQARFCGTDPIKVDLRECPKQPWSKFECNLTRRGGQYEASWNEARIMLGRDVINYESDFREIQFLLEAADGGTNYSNAYYLGITAWGVNSGKLGSYASGVAYFKISKRDHKRLQINPEEQPFKEWIDSLKTEID